MDVPLPPPSCVNENCECSSQSECLAHATCDLETFQCECAVGYKSMGKFCIFDAVRDPDIDGDPAAWGPLSTVAIDPDAIEDGMLSPGAAAWPNSDINALEHMQQQLVMPTLEAAEPFVAVVQQKVVHPTTAQIWAFLAPYAMVRAGAQLSPLPIGALSRWETHRVCLGETAYGGEITFGIEPAQEETEWVRGYEMFIDTVRIEPAGQDECPAPGEVLNGDFESDLGWISVLPAGSGALAEIRDGLGLGGSRAGYGESGANCGQQVGLQTTISVPRSDQGQALQFAWRGSSSASVEVGLGLGEHPHALYWNWVRKHRPIGSVHASSGNLQVERVCIPPQASGTAAPLTFRLLPAGQGCELPQFFVVDQVEIVDAPGCATTGAGSDLGFEAVQNAVLPGWARTIDEGHESVVTMVGAAEAVEGVHVMRLRTDVDAPNCNVPVGIATSLQYPAITAGQVPAIRFSYRFSDTASPQAQLLWSRNHDFLKNSWDDRYLPQTSGWQTVTICAAASYAERPVELTLDFYPGDCTIEEVVDIDAVEVVAIPAGDCP